MYVCVCVRVFYWCVLRIRTGTQNTSPSCPLSRSPQAVKRLFVCICAWACVCLRAVFQHRVANDPQAGHGVLFLSQEWKYFPAQDETTVPVKVSQRRDHVETACREIYCFLLPQSHKSWTVNNRACTICTLGLWEKEKSGIQDRSENTHVPVFSAVSVNVSCKTSYKI